MKKIVFLLFFAALLLPQVASAIHIPDHALPLNLDYPSFGGFDINEDQGLAQIVAWFYALLVGLSGLAAFIMIVWGGIQWMTSAGDPTRTSDAKDRIQKALLGLLLVLASFLILQTINPEFNTLRVPSVQVQPAPQPDSGQTTSSGSASSTGPNEGTLTIPISPPASTHTGPTDLKFYSSKKGVTCSDRCSLESSDLAGTFVWNSKYEFCRGESDLSPIGLSGGLAPQTRTMPSGNLSVPTSFDTQFYTILCTTADNSDLSDPSLIETDTVIIDVIDPADL